MQIFFKQRFVMQMSLSAVYYYIMINIPLWEIASGFQANFLYLRISRTFWIMNNLSCSLSKNLFFYIPISSLLNYAR